MRVLLFLCANLPVCVCASFRVQGKAVKLCVCRFAFIPMSLQLCVLVRPSGLCVRVRPFGCRAKQISFV